MAFPANIELSSLDGSTGFKLSGAAGYDFSGRSVASAGDVNGDGFSDLVVGAYGADPHGSTSGASYVVFGQASGFAATLELSSLDGITGFKLSGAAAYDKSGVSVASAGDVNGDGFADLIVGADGADPNGSQSGASYVVFGQASGFAGTLELSSLDGITGFKLSGVAQFDFSGRSVASAGDVNGDGFTDLIVGAVGVDANSPYVGASYVVFGKASGFASTLELSSLDGSTGFRLTGEATGDKSGFSVASAGDVNGDGLADLIVGAYGADPNGISSSGASYVVFGRATGFSATFDLGSLDSSTGFRLTGVAADDASGLSVASAGDINGDGFVDLIVGAYYGANPNGERSGTSHVVFGKASGFAASIDLGSLDGSNGFTLSGTTGDERSGFSVASAGDVNGDGFADLIVGAYYADSNGERSGTSYVVFGKASGFDATLDLSSLDGTKGFKLSGVAAYDRSGISVASAGDLNGDGFADLIVGASGADPHGLQSGASYVVFGGAFGATVITDGTSAAEMLIGGASDDTLTGGGGADVFHGGAGDDLLIVNDLVFRLADGGTGTDTLALDGAGLSLNLRNRRVATRLEGIEHIDLTGSGDNTLRIDRLGLRVGLGAVSGGMHVLTVEGDAGDRVLLDKKWRKTGTFTDTSGTSFDRYARGNAVIDVEQGVSVPGAMIDGTSGDDTIGLYQTVAGQPFATRRDDVINGREGNDFLDGVRGADTLVGGTGDDTYVVDDAGDVVTENAGAGIDTVRSRISYDLGAGSNVENLTLLGSERIDGTGNELDNTIIGNKRHNVLTGGDGNDRLVGGGGNDMLTGGNGADAFILNSPADGVDRITDFEQGADWLEISAAGFGGGLVAGGAPQVLNAGDPAPGGYFIFDNSRPGLGVLYWDATGGSDADAVKVAVLMGTTSLTAGDFHIV